MRTRLLVIVCALVLSACRVDATIDVTMAENGSGTVTLTAAADAELVNKAPGLATDLRLDDLRSAGWMVDGPSPTPSGGLVVVVRHAFASPEQATALLAAINGTEGPLKAVALSRTATKEAVATALTGTARVEHGLASFTDPDLLAAVGATPYADAIAAQDMTEQQALALNLQVRLPGKVTSNTGTVDTDGLIHWNVPLDGSTIDLTSAGRVSLSGSGPWHLLSTLFRWLLIAWVVAAAVFIGLAARARRRAHR
jgi:hypothetical protein